MRILVTAGNTQTPIDAVRCITNIFTGRTGGNVALEAARRGHDVTLLTSHPEVVTLEKMLRVTSYRTFDDLQGLMADLITHGGFGAVIHAAAVSDYRLAGVYAPNSHNSFPGGQLIDASAGKIKSHHPELWLRLVPTPKLVDCLRRDWGFRGILVKFKLEVGEDENELKRIAAESRVQSDADFVVANTLEEMHSWALIGGPDGIFRKVERQQLARELLAAVETCAANS